MVGNHVAEVLRNSGPDSMPADLAAFVQDRPEYDYSQHVHQGAVHARYVPDEVIDRLCLVGPPEECERRLRQLADVGVTHVNFYVQADDHAAQMEVYARDIIPRLRAHATA